MVVLALGFLFCSWIVTLLTRGLLEAWICERLDFSPLRIFFCTVDGLSLRCMDYENLF
jgi:hypothetical protein